MKILVIDGQGGKLGAQIIGLIKSKNYSNIEIIGVGTNAMASEAFLKAKAFPMRLSPYRQHQLYPLSCKAHPF